MIPCRGRLRTMNKMMDESMSGMDLVYHTVALVPTSKETTNKLPTACRMPGRNLRARFQTHL